MSCEWMPHYIRYERAHGGKGKDKVELEVTISIISNTIEGPQLWDLGKYIRFPLLCNNSVNTEQLKTAPIF